MICELYKLCREIRKEWISFNSHCDTWTKISVTVVHSDRTNHAYLYHLFDTHSDVLVVYHSYWGRVYRSVSPRLGPPREARDEGLLQQRGDSRCVTRHPLYLLWMYVNLSSTMIYLVFSPILLGFTLSPRWGPEAWEVWLILRKHLFCRPKWVDKLHCAVWWPSPRESW